MHELWSLLLVILASYNLGCPQHPRIYFTWLVETKEISVLMSNIWSVELHRNSVDIVTRGKV